jgi:hypothetical protein
MMGSAAEAVETPGKIAMTGLCVRKSGVVNYSERADGGMDVLWRVMELHELGGPSRVRDERSGQQARKGTQRTTGSMMRWR